MGEESVETVTTKREKAIKVFEDGSFKLHKWHSNVMSLELGTNKRETKLLGLIWDKTKDTLSVETTQKPV